MTGGLFFVYALREGTEGDYEENEYVGDVMGDSSRPFLFLPQTVLG